MLVLYENVLLVPLSLRTYVHVTEVLSFEVSHYMCFNSIYHPSAIAENVDENFSLSKTRKSMLCDFEYLVWLESFILAILIILVLQKNKNRMYINHIKAIPELRK